MKAFKKKSYYCSLRNDGMTDIRNDGMADKGKYTELCGWAITIEMHTFKDLFPFVYNFLDLYKYLNYFFVIWITKVWFKNYANNAAIQSILFQNSYSFSVILKFLFVSHFFYQVKSYFWFNFSSIIFDYVSIWFKIRCIKSGSLLPKNELLVNRLVVHE